MPDNLPDIRPPKDFLRGLYDPDFLPKQLNINRFVEDPEKRQEKAVQAAQQRIEQVDLFDINERAPLSEEEAGAIDDKIRELIAQVEATKERISQARKYIDDRVAPPDKEEFALSIDISKKRRLRRAIKKIFGVKTDTLSYSMYKQAIELKRQIEQDEAKAYTKGEY